MNSITPVILAGGKGTRLRGVIPDRPKVIAPIKGRPFVSYILDQLIEGGFEKAVLCVGYLAEMMIDMLGDLYRSLSLIYSREYIPLGTGGALRNALSLVETEDLLVMNGDSFLKINLGDFISWHFQEGFEASIALSEVSDISRYGSVKINGDQTISGFEEKSREKMPGLVNAGIYLFRKSLVEKNINPGGWCSLERDFIPALLGTIAVGGYRCGSELIDIGTPESYRMADAFGLEK